MGKREELMRKRAVTNLNHMNDKLVGLQEEVRQLKEERQFLYLRIEELEDEKESTTYREEQTEETS